MSSFIHERAAAVEDRGPSPHDGAGDAIYHRFFDAVDTRLYLNHVTLPPGGSVGSHLQPFDEIFYVVEGRGTMRVGEETFAVEKGSAVLTRGGSTHSLQAGDDPLVMIVVHAGRHAPKPPL